jgi:hypothetical protein
MKKPLNIFAFVKKGPSQAESDPAASYPAPKDPNWSSWELASEDAEEDFNFSDKSRQCDDENYCTASEGTINLAMKSSAL